MKLLPFAAYIIILGILFIWGAPFSLLSMVAFIAGLVTFSTIEYVVHRFGFHSKIPNRKLKRYITNGHVYHHRNPQKIKKLFIPLSIALPASLIPLGIFMLIFGHMYGFWFYLGMVCLYFLYEFMHYSAHHYPINLPFFRQMREYHLSHHKNKPNSRFSITNPFWDWALNTYR